MRFDWCYIPCAALGGDLFNVVELDERFLAVYVFDVSGHGVPAALLTVTVSRALARHARAHIAQKPQSGALRTAPVQWVAEQLNGEFPMDPVTGQYFTLLYGLLDLQTFDFRFVSAGHPGPVHVPYEGSTSILGTEGGSLSGSFPMGNTRNSSFVLRPATGSTSTRMASPTRRTLMANHLTRRSWSRHCRGTVPYHSERVSTGSPASSGDGTAMGAQRTTCPSWRWKSRASSPRNNRFPARFCSHPTARCG